MACVLALGKGRDGSAASVPLLALGEVVVTTEEIDLTNNAHGGVVRAQLVLRAFDAAWEATGENV